MAAIVTKDSLQHMLDTDNQQYVQMVIGRALVGIFDRQTADEKESNTTSKSNGIGFTGGDAYSGSKTAKFWMKHGSLLDWQVDMWVKKGTTGYSRLAKYHRQLNEIAKDRLT